jgi:hypothetical protein
VGFCDGQKWRWGRFSPRLTSVSPANLHSICFSTIIFTNTRGWHNRPGVAAVPIASQTRLKKIDDVISIKCSINIIKIYTIIYAEFTLSYDYFLPTSFFIDLLLSLENGENTFPRKLDEPENYTASSQKTAPLIVTDMRILYQQDVTYSSKYKILLLLPQPPQL